MHQLDSFLDLFPIQHGQTSPTTAKSCTRKQATKVYRKSEKLIYFTLIF